MPTVVKEAKVKLMESTGDLAYVAEKLGISESEADALRTYEQYNFGDDSPVIKAILDGVEKAGKLVAKSGLNDEAKQIVGHAVASLTAGKLASLLVSGQNEGVKAVRGIPTKEVSTVAVKKDTVTVSDI